MIFTNKYERISALEEILEHFASYQPNDDVPLSKYSEDEKREKEYCEALREVIYDLVHDDDYYRKEDIRSLLEQEYDSRIVKAAMNNSEFIDGTLIKFNKIMDNDDSWVHSLKYAIDENIKRIPEINNSKNSRQEQQLNSHQKQTVNPKLRH